MEATLRTASEWITKDPSTPLEFTEVRAVEGLREVDVEIGDMTVKLGVANGLVNAKSLLDKVVSGEQEFHVIEIMACPGGCIGGGGQPYPPSNYQILDPALCAKRARALYSIDSQQSMRRSHDNPAVKALYDEFLGEPGGPKAHELLHTHYEAKLPRGIR